MTCGCMSWWSGGLPPPSHLGVAGDIHTSSTGPRGPAYHHMYSGYASQVGDTIRLGRCGSTHSGGHPSHHLYVHMHHLSGRASARSPAVVRQSHQEMSPPCTSKRVHLGRYLSALRCCRHPTQTITLYPLWTSLEGLTKMETYEIWDEILS